MGELWTWWNMSGIAAAALAGFLAGGLWYGLLARHWMAAADIDARRLENHAKGRSGGAPRPLLVAVVGELVMALVLFVIIHRVPPYVWPNALDGGAGDLWQALWVAFVLWAGFVATVLAVNYGFQMRPLRLFLIDAGHWLLVLLIMALVIGLMRETG